MSFSLPILYISEQNHLGCSKENAIKMSFQERQNGILTGKNKLGKNEQILTGLQWKNAMDNLADAKSILLFRI